MTQSGIGKVGAGGKLQPYSLTFSRLASSAAVRLTLVCLTVLVDILAVVL